MIFIKIKLLQKVTFNIGLIPAICSETLELKLFYCLSIGVIGVCVELIYSKKYIYFGIRIFRILKKQCPIKLYLQSFMLLRVLRVPVKLIVELSLFTSTVRVPKLNENLNPILS